MQFVNFATHAALNELISVFGMMRADFEQSGISTIYPFPWSAQIRLNFTVHGNPLSIRKGDTGLLTPLPHCSLIGPQLCRNTVYFDPKSVMICMCFNPGGFHRLTGIPVHELTDKDLDAGELFGKGIWQVARDVQSSAGPEQMKSIIEGFFLKRVQWRETDLQPFDLAISRWAFGPAAPAISEVAKDACLSIRQFERKCSERLGMGPKLFARLIRFSKAHALAEHQTGRSWTGIAYECGYYDQMHMIRDFRKFAGITPQILADNTGHSLNLTYFLETAPDAHHYLRQELTADITQEEQLYQI